MKPGAKTEGKKILRGKKHCQKTCPRRINLTTVYSNEGLTVCMEYQFSIPFIIGCSYTVHTLTQLEQVPYLLGSW